MQLPNRTMLVISVNLPRCNLFPDIFNIVDSPIKALPRKHIQFYLSHVQPASMLSPSSAVQKLKVSESNKLRFRSAYFSHYIFDKSSSIRHKDFHPLQQNLQLF